MTKTLQEKLRDLEQAAQVVLDELLDEINEGEDK
jgi:predicted RNase H-like HicB family nuclease